MPFVLRSEYISRQSGTSVLRENSDQLMCSVCLYVFIITVSHAVPLPYMLVVLRDQNVFRQCGLRETTSYFIEHLSICIFLSYSTFSYMLFVLRSKYLFRQSGLTENIDYSLYSVCVLREPLWIYIYLSLIPFFHMLLVLRSEYIPRQSDTSRLWGKHWLLFVFCVLREPLWICQYLYHTLPFLYMPKYTDWQILGFFHVFCLYTWENAC